MYGYSYISFGNDKYIILNNNTKSIIYLIIRLELILYINLRKLLDLWNIYNDYKQSLPV